MLDSRDIGGLQGAPVIGRDNDRLGTVGQVFLDAVSGTPNWVTVKSGLFGHKETFVPLANATWDGEEVHTDIDHETFKEAPRIDADEALTPHNEEALYRYYGLSDADSDGGTARPGDYPERDYDIGPHGETVTPVPTSAARSDADRTADTDADRTRETDADYREPRDLRLSEQPLGDAPTAAGTRTGEHTGKHARLRRYDPATDDTSATGEPTIDRNDPPRNM